MKFKLVKSKFLANWSIKIISLAAAVVLYYVNYYNTLDTYKIEMPVTILLPAGFALSAPYVDTASLTIRGNKELGITKLEKEDFEVIADLSAETKIRNNEAITVNLDYEKKKKALAAETMSVILKPQTIILKLEKKVEKWVKILPNITPGSPPEGYMVDRIELYPEKILITGPQSRVNAVDNLITEPISFENRKKDFFLAVKPLLPDSYLTVIDPLVLEFKASISEIVSEKEFSEISITALNINEQLILDSALPVGIIKFRASYESLNNLDMNTIRIIINCENIKQQGRYTLRAVPEYPPELVLVDYSPQEVQIDLIPRYEW